MSSPRSNTPPLLVREAAVCMCDHGGRCSSFEPGHALHLIQSRLASATPSDWADAFVDDADAATGVIRLTAFATGEQIVVWSASGAAIDLAPGTPVALHARYDVLAIGGVRYNVAR